MTVTGSTIVITGASSGIGRVAASVLAEQGAQIAVVGRNPERTHAVAAAVGGTAFLANFDRLDDVRSLAEALLQRFDAIDVLANNAGGLVTRRATTQDGFERTFQSNHLAPFLLTTLLLPRLIASEARVISTASVANVFGSLKFDDLNFDRRPWLGGWRAYGTSKLMSILFMRELARRTSSTKLQAFSFHPGYVTTGFGQGSPLLRLTGALGPRFRIAPEQGAAPLIHLASTADVGMPSGTYFHQFAPEQRLHPRATDSRAAAELWERSAALVEAAGVDP
ncbi:MAG: short-chain dehydrogenase [Homoserinimonas sp.]|nr:short-chain dehydrogenase [Homoserinimonas sp.]